MTSEGTRSVHFAAGILLVVAGVSCVPETQCWETATCLRDERDASPDRDSATFANVEAGERASGNDAHDDQSWRRDVQPADAREEPVRLADATGQDTALGLPFDGAISVDAIAECVAGERRACPGALGNCARGSQT